MDWNCDSEHRSTHHLLTQAPALARKFNAREHLTSDGGLETRALHVGEGFFVQVTTTEATPRARRAPRGPASRRSSS